MKLISFLHQGIASYGIVNGDDVLDTYSLAVGVRTLELVGEVEDSAELGRRPVGDAEEVTALQSLSDRGGHGARL